MTRTYLAIAAVLLIGASAWFLYSKGYTDGANEVRLEYASAPAKIDTVREYVYVETPVYRERRVAVTVPDPRVDSLLRVTANKDSLIRYISERAARTFETPELGRLDVGYVPLDRLFAIDHKPPQAKIERVTITIEKPVLIRESFWQKLDEYVIAGGVGAVAVWLAK